MGCGVTASLGTIELRPSSDLMLALDAIYRATNRLAGAIEQANTIQTTDRSAALVDAIKAAAADVLLGAPAPKKPMSPEYLEKLRQGAAKAQLAAAAKLAAERLAGTPPVSRYPAQERMFTPERDAIIRRDYPLGVSTDVILRQCHTLPGKFIPHSRISIRAAKIGARRPVYAPAAVLAPARAADAVPLSASPAAVSPSALDIARQVIVRQIAESAHTRPAMAPEPPILPPTPPAIDLSGLSALGAVVERKPAQVAAPSAPKPPVAAPQPKSRMEAMLAVSKAIEARPPVDPGAPVAADFNQIKHWAAQRGVAFADWDDLRAVNSRRDRLGLAPFKRDFSKVRAA